jgi:hypothetical protein
MRQKNEVRKMISQKWTRIGRGEECKNVEDGGIYLVIADHAGAVLARFVGSYSPALLTPKGERKWRRYLWTKTGGNKPAVVNKTGQ